MTEFAEREGLMVNEDALEGAVNREELDRFKARHPSFAAAAPRLQEMLGRALNVPNEYKG